MVADRFDRAWVYAFDCGGGLLRRRERCEACFFLLRCGAPRSSFRIERTLTEL